MLAKSLKFSIKLKVKKNEFGCSFNETTKSMTGFCNLLYRGKVDLAGFPCDTYYSAFQFVDPTAIYYMFGFRLISVNPSVEKEVNFTLNPSLLVGVLCICVIMAILMIISERINGGNYFNRYFRVVFDILSILFLEAIRFRNIRMNHLIIL